MDIVQFAVNSDANTQGLVDTLQEAGIASAEPDINMLWVVNVSKRDFDQYWSEVQSAKAQWSAYEI